jgi:DNA-binding CsgD family transcriptional regulator
MKELFEILMMPTKTLLINNIALTYKNEASPLLTPSEVTQYIQSAAFFEDVLRFHKTGIFIIEYRTWSYLYCSSNIEEITGYSASDALKYGPKFTLSHLHTDDLGNQEKAHRLSVEIFRRLPDKEKGRYKFAFTFKHINPNGETVVILQTSIFLKWDDQGRPLVKLILVTDISAYKHNNDVVFFVSQLNAAGRNHIVVQKNFSDKEAHILSTREMEIVHLIAQERSSGNIAQRLGISLNTVKNHRKSILAKLGCRNRAQLISLAKLYGLLPDEQNLKKSAA